MPITGMNRPLMSGLVLWLKMSEGVGLRLHDVSGYQNNCALNGVLWAAGKYGQAASFDGIASYGTILDASSLDLTTEITISLWIKPGGADTYNAMLIKETASDGWDFLLHNGKIRFDKVISGTGNDSLAQGNDLRDGNWHHIIVTFGGTTIKLYVDTEVVYSNAGWTAGIGANNNDLIVAQRGGTTNFNGIMDDIRIYSRVLTIEEIYQLYRERGYE